MGVAGNLGRDGVRGGGWQRRGESRVAAIGRWRARRDAGLVAAHAEGVACYHSAGLAPRLAPRRPSLPVHALALVSPKIISKDPSQLAPFSYPLWDPYQYFLGSDAGNSGGFAV